VVERVIGPPAVIISRLDPGCPRLGLLSIVPRHPRLTPSHSAALARQARNNEKPWSFCLPELPHKLRINSRPGRPHSCAGSTRDALTIRYPPCGMANRILESGMDGTPPMGPPACIGRPTISIGFLAAHPSNPFVFHASDHRIAIASVRAPAQTCRAQPPLYRGKSSTGSSYIFRALSPLPPLTNRHGTPAGAFYGYTTCVDSPTGYQGVLESRPTWRWILDASAAHPAPRNESYAPVQGGTGRRRRRGSGPAIPAILVATPRRLDPVHRRSRARGRDISPVPVTAAKKGPGVG